MLNSETELYGVLGNPIKHSLSPKLHNALFDYYQINAVYLAFEVNNITMAFDGIRGLGIKGVNITLPFKEDAREFVDEVRGDALVVGAINTVKNRDGVLYGYNTDVFGFQETIKQVDYRNKNITILGAGGVARSVIYALCKLGVKHVNVMNRTMENACRLRDMFDCVDIDCYELSEDKIVASTDILINATSVGLDGVSVPVNIEGMNGGCVIDVIYFDTPLLREARRRGLKVINGMVMFVNQALLSFEIWTGLRCERDFAFNVLGEGKV